MIEEAIEELKTHQTQLDQDGVMVGVSRQALEELLAHVAAPPALIAGLEPVAWRFTKLSVWHVTSERNWAEAHGDCVEPLYTRAQLEAHAAEQVRENNSLLRAVVYECWSLHCVDVPTGGDDADVGWEVVSHHQAKPHDRVVAFGKTPTEAIVAAIRARGQV